MEATTWSNCLGKFLSRGQQTFQKVLGSKYVQLRRLSMALVTAAQLWKGLDSQEEPNTLQVLCIPNTHSAQFLGCHHPQRIKNSGFECLLCP